MLALQRTAGNAAVAAMLRPRGATAPMLHRCEKCKKLRDKLGPKAGFDQLADYLAVVGERQLKGALELAREWNANHPDRPVGPAQFTRLPGNAEVAAALAPAATPDETPGTKTEETAVGESGASDPLETEAQALQMDLQALVDRPCDYGEHLERIAPEPGITRAAQGLLKQLGALRRHGEGASRASEQQKLIQRVLELKNGRVKLSTPDCTAVYLHARALGVDGMAADKTFEQCLALAKRGTMDHLKGLVGEYLGRQRAVQLRPTLAQHTAIRSLRVIRLSDRTPSVSINPNHSAPTLPVKQKQGKVGTTVGEIDTLYCTVRPNLQLVPVLALESKGGNLGLSDVARQKEKIARNFQFVITEPTNYCFAERVDDEWDDVTHRFDMPTTQIEIQSTGPIRKKDTEHFDIELQMSLDQMSALLNYLCLVAPGDWGSPITVADLTAGK